jgi:tetratricopeptide (TPR) repeat protein
MFGPWIYKKAAPNSLAQFVTTAAADGLSLDLIPTDHLNTPEGRGRLVRAIYEAFRSRERPIDYALPPYTPEDVEQRVRHPRQILNPPGQGTCLDLALLFCGACKAFRLLPVLVVLDGHAFAAVSLRNTIDEWRARSRGERVHGEKPESGGLWRDEDLVRGLFESGTYLPVECTGFARTASLAETVPEGRGRDRDGFLPFERAVTAGREQLEPGGRRFLFALDVPTVQFYWGIGPDELGMAVTTPVDTSRLPETPGDFVGREEELKQLESAWQSAGRTRIVTVVAWGGVGKTALVKRWRDEMARGDGPKPDAEFAWSFYNQGTSGNGVDSAAFINEALLFFGEEHAERFNSPWDRGRELARRVNRQRTLLILDGLEPLQSAHAPGQLQDPALQALLKGLVEPGPGLCVITTRVPVVELAGRPADAVTLNLGRLSKEAGAQVLRGLGVQGQDKELEEASKAVEGHALTLQLLGRYLAVAFKPPHVRHARDVLLPRADEKQGGGHATRVLRRYVQWLGEASPEAAVLHLVGLFNRPADPDSLTALREEPAIPGLTDLITPLSDQDWNTSLSHLADLGLVTLRLSESLRHSTPWLDAHPLVREHFAAELQSARPEAWRAGHDRLYDYLKGVAPARPKTTDRMMPLFHAMGHGCAGRQYPDALREVYEKRILQNADGEWLYYSTDVLGQYGASLAALAGFFAEVWHRPVAALSRRDQAFVLHEAAVHLRSLSRLAESLRSFRGAVDRYVAEKDLSYGSQSTRYLGETYTLVGDLKEAETWAEKSVEFSVAVGDRFEEVLNRTSLGDTLHQAGRLDDAERQFEAAARVRDEKGEPIPNHFFFWGFGHCELLLTRGRAAEAIGLARRALEQLNQTRDSVLACAQIHLALGRALLADRQAGATDFVAVTTHLDLALSNLNKSNHQVHIPRGRLALADLCRARGDLDGSKAHLDEALEIAIRDPQAPMRLYQADCYLGYCRLHLAQGGKEQARRDLDAARKVIQQTGYHRRDSELEELERML